MPLWFRLPITIWLMCGSGGPLLAISSHNVLCGQIIIISNGSEMVNYRNWTLY